MISRIIHAWIECITLCASFPIYASCSFINTLVPIKSSKMQDNCYNLMMVDTAYNALWYKLVTQNCRFCFANQTNCTRKNIAEQVKSHTKPSIVPIPATITGIIICSLLQMMKFQCIVKQQSQEITHIHMYMNGMLYENKLNMHVQRNGLNINIYNSGYIIGSFVYHQSPFKKTRVVSPKSQIIQDNASDSTYKVNIYES